MKTAAPKAYFASRLEADSSRERLWQCLCEYLQPQIPSSGRVLELGGGYCCFINNVKAAEKHVVDTFDGVHQMAGPDVTAHAQSCTDLANFRDSWFDVVFASNLFEHLTREELCASLAEVWRVLQPGGKLLIIQPNFKYCYRDYFDDYTHVAIYTDISLVDILKNEGFVAEKVIPKFLPFSLKSKGPKWTWLLRLYLRLPWRPFAGQMYILARKIALQP